MGYISKVIGVSHERLKEFPDHDVWRRVGYYIAQLAVNVFFTTSAEKIVIGGGLSHNPYLFGYVRENFNLLINKYVEIPENLSDEDHPILSKPKFDDTNGLFGAVLAFNC